MSCDVRHQRASTRNRRRCRGPRIRPRIRMSADTRLLVYALGAVVALIVLIARFKLHPFVALILVSLAMGVAAGMPPRRRGQGVPGRRGQHAGFHRRRRRTRHDARKDDGGVGRCHAHRDHAHRSVRRTARALGHHVRRLHRRDPRVLPGGFRSAHSARVHDRAAHGDVARQDRDPAGGRPFGGARDAAATPGGDARRDCVQRRRRPHDSLRPARRPPDRCAGGADLRDVDRAPDRAARRESSRGSTRRRIDARDAEHSASRSSRC